MISILFNRNRLQFLPAGGAEALLELDARISETPEFKNEVTLHPVEDGSSVADHIRVMPEKVVINGLVSSSPVRFADGLRVALADRDRGGTRIRSAYDVLMSMAGYRSAETEASRFDYIHSEPILVDIITRFRVYTSMALTSLTIPRDRAVGESLQFTAEFVKVRKVQSQTAVISHVVERPGAEGARDQAASLSELGKVQPKPIDDRTIAKRLLDSIANKAKGNREFEFLPAGAEM